MATKVLAPRLGEGVNELTIVRWFKQEGETVKELESLLEVETDKVVTEIPSPASGTLLKLVVPESGLAGVGTVIAWIGQPGEIIPGAGSPMSGVPASGGTNGKTAGENDPGSAVRDTAYGARSSGFISPLVAKIAREKNVDLQQVRGSGLGGRITKKDILDFLEMEANPGLPDNPPGDRLIPHTVIRKAIAERMLLSTQTSPHVMTVMEADMSRVVTHRTANKEIFARDGANLTFTPYFMMAVVAGLKAFPTVNSSWTEAGLNLHAVYNIGMATSLGEDGLIVPVIRDADQLSLAGIARVVNDLGSRARAKKLRPDEVKGGTFTVTNHGVSGSLFSMPIINQPQCGILGTGAIQKRAVVVADVDGNDAIAIRSMAYLSFVFDHRILDGAIADLFLSKVVESLENWH